MSTPLNGSERLKGGTIPIGVKFISPDPIAFNLTNAIVEFEARTKSGAQVVTLSTANNTLTRNINSAAEQEIKGNIPAESTADLSGASIQIAYVYSITVNGLKYREKSYCGEFTLIDPFS